MVNGEWLMSKDKSQKLNDKSQMVNVKSQKINGEW